MNISKLKRSKSLFLSLGLFYAALLFFNFGLIFSLIDISFNFGIIAAIVSPFLLGFLFMITTSLLKYLTDYTIRDAILSIHTSFFIILVTILSFISVLIINFLPTETFFYLAIVLIIISAIIFYYVTLYRKEFKGVIYLREIYSE